MLYLEKIKYVEDFTLFTPIKDAKLELDKRYLVLADYKGQTFQLYVEYYTQTFQEWIPINPHKDILSTTTITDFRILRKVGKILDTMVQFNGTGPTITHVLV